MLLRPVLFFLAALCVLTTRAHAYSLTGSRWTGSSTTMQLQLGAGSGTLLDGFTSWGESAEDALTLWNNQMGSFRVAVVRDSAATRSPGNRLNNVHFAADIYGQAWGSGVLAVTLTYTSGSAHTETDVVFNTRITWNSYRGVQRYTGTGTPIYDFHRVALHEFGHALGLEHPDENGQSVTALMNSRISTLDTITNDDISGVRALYGAPATTAPVVAPSIVTQPVGPTVTAGQSATLAVVAGGTAPLTYQWFKDNVAVTGATTASLTFSSAAVTNTGLYFVVVANSAGSATSASVTLTVNAPAAPTTTTPTTPSTPTTITPSTPTATTPTVPTTPVAPVVTAPAIITHPVSQAAIAGTSVSLTVSASGTAPFVYQWRKNGSAMAGATSATLTLSNVQSADAGVYTVLVSNSAATATSASAVLTVLVPPVITSQPVAQSVAAGSRVSFTVVATGGSPLSYQWRRDGALVGGATGATYTIESAQTTHAGNYTVAVTNPGGTATSAAVRLEVSSVPVIGTPPVAQTISVGERATFSVALASGGPATYQWLRDGTEIPGATNAQFSIELARASDNAAYSVRVTNAAGTVSSTAATLTVRFSRLVNLSTRGYVPAGGALTPGFYLRGAQPKSVLVRGVGPTLSLFGVGTALGEARLDLIAQDTSAVLASNNDWGGTTQLRDTFASVGAFPLAADSRDAAVQTSLPPRGYTARITPGDPTMAGITLAEIYDVEPLVGTASQLANVSTLGFVGTGENALTAGFVISGNAPKRLLIRAIGPGLAPFGVGNLLSDPQLGLVPLGRSEPIATNDDWPDLVNVRSAFTTAGAFPLSVGSKDSALVITLEPGAYTVMVSGVSGATTGQALVEIYDLDP